MHPSHYNAKQLYCPKSILTHINQTGPCSNCPVKSVLIFSPENLWLLKYRSCHAYLSQSLQNPRECFETKLPPIPKSSSVSVHVLPVLSPPHCSDIHIKIITRQFPRHPSPFPCFRHHLWLYTTWHNTFIYLTHMFSSHYWQQCKTPKEEILWLFCKHIYKFSFLLACGKFIFDSFWHFLEAQYLREHLFLMHRCLWRPGERMAVGLPTSELPATNSPQHLHLHSPGRSLRGSCGVSSYVYSCVHHKLSQKPALKPS